MMRRPAFFLLLLLALGSLAGCESRHQPFATKFLAFGTFIDLTIAGVPREQAEQAAAIIEQDFQRMHRSWHAWDPGPLGRVNRLIKSGESFSAPPSVLPLIVRGKELSEKSEGLFNPAIGLLIDAWGFHSNDPEGHRPPDDERLGELLRLNPNMSDLEIDGIRIKSHNSAIKLDFGAFGKGYGIDMAMTHLPEMGIHNAILNAGGDLRAIGSKSGTPWKIAIRHPSGEGIIAIIETRDSESVFTSGDYERNFTWQGQRYHHIIDPRTGFPATGTRSVTVIHNDATVADAAATALFIAGPENWYRIAQKMGLKYVLLVDQEGLLHMNPGMEKRIELMGEGHRIRLSPPLNEAASAQ